MHTSKSAALRCVKPFSRHHFLLDGWPGGTDTYKRTMWAAVPDIALAHAAYALTMRRGLPEAGAPASSWLATKQCWPNGFIALSIVPTSS